MNPRTLGIQLDVGKPRSDRERIEAILTHLEPGWCEQFEGDRALAAEFFRMYSPAAWAIAEKLVGA